MGATPRHRLLRTKATSHYLVSNLEAEPWDRFKRAVYEAVCTEACPYHDCTPIMACLRAADSESYPMAATRLDWDSRMRETCRALNELTEAGLIEAKVLPWRWGEVKRHVFRPYQKTPAENSDSCSTSGGTSDTKSTPDSSRLESPKPDGSGPCTTPA